MTEEDWKVVQLVLTLFRNLLAIPDPQQTAASGNDHLTRGRDDLLARLFKEDVTDLLLAVAQDAARLPFRNEAALLLEIFYELFKGVTPETLFLAADRQAAAEASVREGAVRSHAAKKDHEASAALRAALGGERTQAKNAVRTAGGAPRHARFGGTYVRELPGGGGSALVRNAPGAPLASAAALKFTSGVGGRSKPRLVGPQRTHLGGDAAELLTAGAGSSAPLGAGRAQALITPSYASTAVQAQVKALAVAFLAGPYNALMAVVLGDLLVGRAPGLSDHEVKLRTLHFLRVTTFGTAFVRVSIARKAAQPGGGDSAAAAPQSEEVPSSPWAAVAETMDARAFHWVRTEWLRLCDAKPAEPAAVAAAGAALHQMLAVLLAALTASFGAAAAADRRVATALALRVLTDDTAEEGVLANLHKLVRTFDPRRFTRAHMATLALAVDTVLQLLQALSESADGALHVTQRRKGGGRRAKKPAAAALEEEEGITEEERAAAAAERERLAGDAAAAAARAAQEGGDGASQPQDVAADLQEGGIDMGDGDSEREGGYGSGEEEGDAAQGKRLREVKLDLPKRTARLFEPQTVCNYVWLLKHWRVNEPQVNQVTVAVLTRLDGLSLAPMMYQLSILTILYDILGDPAARQPQFAAVQGYARRTVRGLFDRMLPPPGPSTPDAPAAPIADDGDANGRQGSSDAEAVEVPEKQAAPPTGPEAAGRLLFVDILFWKPRGAAINLELDCGRFDGQGGAYVRGVAAERADIAGALARGGGGGQPPARRRRGLLSDSAVDVLKALFEANKEEPKAQFAATLLQGMADAGAELTRAQLHTQLRSLGLYREDSRRRGPAGLLQSRVARREANRTAMDFDDDDDDDDEDALAAEARLQMAAAGEGGSAAAARAALAASKAAKAAALDDDVHQDAPAGRPSLDGPRGVVVRKAKQPEPAKRRRASASGASKRRKARPAASLSDASEEPGGAPSASSPPLQLTAAERLKQFMQDSSDDEEEEQEEVPTMWREPAREGDATEESDDEALPRAAAAPASAPASAPAAEAAVAPKRVLKRAGGGAAASQGDAKRAAVLPDESDEEGGGAAARGRRVRAVLDSDDE